MRRVVGSEEDLALQLARYLRYAHSDVLFHFDYGSGLKMTMGQAVRQKRLNERSWPDLFIAVPTRCEPLLAAEGDTPALQQHGLFLELKRAGTRLRKRNGDWASNHLAEQAATLERLRAAGYGAEFAVGIDEAVRLIDNYLGADLEALSGVWSRA